MRVLEPILNFSSGFTEDYAPIISIPIWFLLGSLIGATVGFLKKKKSSPLR